MKLVVTDLDGTLLSNLNEISLENLKSIEYLKNQGVDFAIASGRMNIDIEQICKSYGISAHIISDNGAVVKTKDNDLLYEKHLNPNHVSEFIKILHENHVFFGMSTGESIYMLENSLDIISNEFDRIPKSMQLWDRQAHIDKFNLYFFSKFFSKSVPLKELYEIIDITNSISIYSLDKPKMEKLFKQFHKYENIKPTYSSHINFELIHHSSNKGNAITLLAKKLNIDLKDVMVLGDSFNDLEMFKVAGTSIAMGNGIDELKNICSHVTKTNIENGFSHAVYKFIDGK